jgi:hypothetical protein
MKVNEIPYEGRQEIMKDKAAAKARALFADFFNLTP